MISKSLQKVETQKRNTVVIIYFDYLDRREVCPTLHAYKVVKVTNHKPVPVIMYDYYDNGKTSWACDTIHTTYLLIINHFPLTLFAITVRRARQFYRAPKSQICDICEYANCGSLCEKAEKRESRGQDVNDLLEARINKAEASIPMYGVLIIATIASAFLTRHMT